MVDALTKRGISKWAWKTRPDDKLPEAKLADIRGELLSSMPIAGTIANNAVYLVDAAIWTPTAAGTLRGGFGPLSETLNHQMALPRPVTNDDRLRSLIVVAYTGSADYDEIRWPLFRYGNGNVDIGLKFAAAVGIVVRFERSFTADNQHILIRGKGDTVPANSEIRVYAGY